MIKILHIIIQINRGDLEMLISNLYLKIGQANIRVGILLESKEIFAGASNIYNVAYVNNNQYNHDLLKFYNIFKQNFLDKTIFMKVLEL